MISDTKREQIKRLHITEGLGVVAISKALDLSVELVRAALGLDAAAEAPKLERPPVAPRRGVDPDLAAVMHMNALLRDRCGGPGYAVAPGGGRTRDGRPAPVSLAEMHMADRLRFGRRFGL